LARSECPEESNSVKGSRRSRHIIKQVCKSGTGEPVTIVDPNDPKTFTLECGMAFDAWRNRHDYFSIGLLRMKGRRVALGW
jgi:hypothetical protein